LPQEEEKNSFCGAYVFKGAMKYVRIKKNGDFTKIFTKGKRSRAATLSIIYSPSDKFRMGICISKKYGKAVKRNRIKRLIRAAFKDEKKRIKNASILVLPKIAEEYSYAAFKRDLQYILRKENLYEK